MHFRFLSCALGMGCWLLTAAVVTQPLPPAPDSLRAALAAAPRGEARFRALLRVTEAFTERIDPAAEAYALAAERQGRTLADSTLVGEALVARAAYYLYLGDVPRTQQVLQRATPLLRTAPPVARAELAFHLGVLADLEGRVSRALGHYRHAYQLFGAVRNRRQQAEILNSMGIAFLRDNRIDSAAKYLVAALQQFRRNGQQQSEASALYNLASVAQAQNQGAHALRYIRQAYALQVAAADTVAMAESLSGMSAILIEVDSLSAALDAARRAQRLYRHIEQPELVISLESNIANIWEKAGQLDSAEVYRLRGIAGQERTHGPDLHLEYAHLAEFYQRQHRWPEAARWASRALAPAGSRSAPLEAQVIAYGVLQSTAWANGDTKQAYRLLQEAVAKNNEYSQQRTDEAAHALRVRYDADQAEQQVRLLTQERELLAQRRELAELRAQRQQLVFGALGVVLVGIGVAAFTYLRRRQRRQQQALRHQLAADLHDDVGSLLTQITLSTSALQAGVYSPEQLAGRHQQLADASRRAMRQMRDVVTGLDQPPPATVGALVEQLRDYAFELLGAADIALDLTVAPGLTDRALLPATSQYLYLIFKEALHNVVKHAHATTVSVRLTRPDARHLELLIADDGRGYTGSGRPGGHGLTNMRTRAEALGGSVAYEPGANGGFAVRVRVGA
jgi:signal transduction histidine kinase